LKLAQIANATGPEGAGALARALEKMTGLRKLEMVSGVGVGRELKLVAAVQSDIASRCGDQEY
jgi:hypothetical protein